MYLIFINNNNIGFTVVFIFLTSLVRRIVGGEGRGVGGGYQNNFDPGLKYTVPIMAWHL